MKSFQNWLKHQYDYMLRMGIKNIIIFETFNIDSGKGDGGHTFPKYKLLKGKIIFENRAILLYWFVAHHESQPLALQKPQKVGERWAGAGSCFSLRNY